MLRAFLFLFLFVSHFISNAQITGKVFKDINGDGIQQVIEANVGGVIVNAYDITNTVISTTTTLSNGTYSLPYTVPVRVEFEIPSTQKCFNPSMHFSAKATVGENIRFIYATTSNVDWAIQNPKDFSLNNNPMTFMPRMVRGDPLALGGSSGTKVTFIGHPYSTSGIVGSSTYELFNSQVGCLWGVAYSRHAKKVFTSAFIKRHSGLGPMGSGGIYLLEPAGTSFNVTQFYDMDANGYRTRAAATAPAFGPGSSFNLNAGGTQTTYLGAIDPLTGEPEGLGVVGVNGAGGRGLTGNVSDQWNDPAAFDQVGKVGIGDIDISEDGKFLFVMNLYSRRVFRLELNDVYNPTSVIKVDSFALPNIIVNNGKLRAFGLNFNNGNLYVGAVTTGENGGQNIVGGATDLYAYVFQMPNPTATVTSISSTPVITFPLNYQKGYAIAGVTGGDQWNRWTNNTADLITLSEEVYPTPILSDIEFSETGDLIMNFCDRAGHQWTGNSYQHLSGSTAFVGSLDVGGDILIAGYNCNTGNYSLENNGSYTSILGTFNGGVGNGEGIGGGEFFQGDEWGGGFHAETSVGSMAQLYGSGEIIASVMDPINAFSNGTGKFSLTNGTSYGHADLANSFDNFGKANSMGDIELYGDIPTLEIGNRVWLDTSENGIQDPGEFGVNDVTVELYADFNNDNVPDGAALASVQTSVDGNFIFNHLNVPDGDPIEPGNQTGISAYKNYLLRIGSADWSGSSGAGDLSGFLVTQTNIGGSGQPDVRDNDASVINNFPTISVQAKMNGQNDHSEDFGFIPCKVASLSDAFLDCNNPSAVIGPTPNPSYTYSWQPAFGLNITNIPNPIASPNITTSYTLTIDGACPLEMTIYVDNITPVLSAGMDQSLTCFVDTVQIGTPAIDTYSYLWYPPTGLSNDTIAQPFVSGVGTTTYLLTVKGSNGCTSQDLVTVFSDICCSKLVVPNSFSPNADNMNDDFGIIQVIDVDVFSLKVFNRYGEEIFTTTDKNYKWDGNYKGKPCETGVYFYTLKYNCVNGDPIFIKGDVTLIR